ncbi:MAG: hypothetical protein KAI53_00985 [Candidatus Aenigmarchaeota archaeon]|nr:hypothetical protein [Candidatus Aenigmarchaeota archaeon]
MELKNTKILLLGILLATIFMSGCTDQEFKPDVKLSLDKNSITVTEKELSEFITATISRQDSNTNETVFILKFPEYKKNVYPTDVNGNRITELQTKSLVGQNSKDIVQFKVFATKGEGTTITYDLKIELWWDDTKIQDKVIKIAVK